MKVPRFVSKTNFFLHIFLLLLIIFIVKSGVISNKKMSDEIKFKKEYEKYNNVADGDFSKFQSLNILEQNKVKYTNANEFKKLLDDGETFLLLIGSPTSSYARMVLPGLIDAVQCSCLEELYYIDASNIRDEYDILDGKLEKIKDSTDEYKSLLKNLEDKLDDYVIYSDGKEYSVHEKRIEIPTLIAVKNGKILKLETNFIELDSNQNLYSVLTVAQTRRIKKNIETIIDAITKETQTCDEHC